MSVKAPRNVLFLIMILPFLGFIEPGHAAEETTNSLNGSGTGSVSVLAPREGVSLRKGSTYRVRWRCLGKCHKMRIHFFKQLCHQRCVPVYVDGRLIRTECTRNICRPAPVTMFKAGGIRSLPAQWYFNWRVPESWKNGKYMVLIEPASNPGTESLKRHTQVYNGEAVGGISPWFELRD